MNLARAALLLVVLAGGCSSKQPAPRGEPGSGSAIPATAPALVIPPVCEAQRAKLTRLYAAEAGSAATFTADNTHMVLVDCARDPARVAACVEAAADIAAIEARCVIPLDAEGSEGDAR